MCIPIGLEAMFCTLVDVLLFAGVNAEGIPANKQPSLIREASEGHVSNSAIFSGLEE